MKGKQPPEIDPSRPAAGDCVAVGRAAVADFCRRFGLPTPLVTWDESNTFSIEAPRQSRLSDFEALWPYLASRLLSSGITSHYTSVRLTRARHYLAFHVDTLHPPFRSGEGREGTLRRDREAGVSFDVSPVLIVGGWSGAGKTTVIEELRSLLGESFFTMPQYTTRPPRPGEADGGQYYFSSLKRAQVERNPRFSDVTEVRGSLYWIDLVDELESLFGKPHAVYSYTMSLVDRVAAARKKWPQSLFIWLEAPSASILERLRTRGDLDISKSLRYNATLDGRLLADRVVSNLDGQLDRATAEVADLVQQQLAVPPK